MINKKELNISDIIDSFISRGYNRETLNIALYRALEITNYSNDKSKEEFDSFIIELLVSYSEIEKAKVCPKLLLSRKISE